MSNDIGKYQVNDAQQRVCKILGALAGHELEGLSQVQIAEMIGSTSGRVHHDLRKMASQQMVEKMDSNRWRLGPPFVRIALDFQSAMNRMFVRAEEIKQRYAHN